MSSYPPRRAKPKIAVGTRLEIWSSDEAKYVPGELINQRDDDCWKIDYDTSAIESHWISLSRASWRILYPRGSREALEQDQQKARLATLTVGSRVKVFWRPCRKWFSGTITDIEAGQKEGYLISYDGKDETWEDLFSEAFTVLDDTDDREPAAAPHHGALKINISAEEASQIEVGTRISILLVKKDIVEMQMFFDGTVIRSTMTHRGRGSKFIRVKFDDGDTLDVDLSRSTFRKLEHFAATATARPNKNTKRKLRSAEARVERKRQKQEVAALKATCALCHTDDMVWPRSLKCCHVFCLDCVKNACVGETKTCPICYASLGTPVRLYFSETLPHAFQAVISTHLASGAVASYSSASAATVSLGIPSSPRVIVDACNSNSFTSNRIPGYMWNFYSYHPR
jgi:hypothetical protein